MNLKFLAGILTGALWLAVLGAATATAHADSITYEQMLFTSPVLGFSGSNDVTASGASSLPAGYTFSGEFCENAFCSSPISTSADSLLRLTNVTLTCNGDGSDCAPIDITFEALGASQNGSPVPSSPVLVSLSLDGTGTASGFATICIADSISFCTSELSGPQSFSFGFNNFILGSASGAVVAPSGFDVYGNLHFNGLADGASVVLNNSLDLGINVPNPVPEPASFALGGSGIVFIAFLVWRRKSTLRTAVSGVSSQEG
jgi:hypothetical protein